MCPGPCIVIRTFRGTDWAKNDPATALAKYRELEIGNPRLLQVLIHGATTKDPAVAARTFEQFNSEEVAEVGSVLVGGWAKKDPAAAFAWAHQHGIAIDQRADPLRAKADSSRLMRYETEYSYQSPLETAARSQPEALAAFLRSLPPGPERDRYIQQTVLAAADKPAVQAFISELPMVPYIASAQLSRLVADIPKAEEYVRQLPQGPARDHAWNQLGSCLNEPLPIEPGPDRDAMLQGMARRQMHTPEVAWSRLRDIGDATKAGFRRSCLRTGVSRTAFRPACRERTSPTPGSSGRIQEALARSLPRRQLPSLNRPRIDLSIGR